MVTRLPAARRRRQLLDVALEVFADRGFRASMDDLAEAAGVSKPVLYQHFRSKRALYVELLGDVADRLLDAITTATTSAASPRQQVEAGFVAYFGFVAAHPSAFRLLFGSGPRGDEEFADAARRVESSIADGVALLIEADVDVEHRRLLAYGIVGLAESSSRRWISGEGELDPETVARRVADLAWAGLRGIRPR